MANNPWTPPTVTPWTPPTPSWTPPPIDTTPGATSADALDGDAFLDQTFVTAAQSGKSFGNDTFLDQALLGVAQADDSECDASLAAFGDCDGYALDSDPIDFINITPPAAPTTAAPSTPSQAPAASAAIAPVAPSPPSGPLNTAAAAAPPAQAPIADEPPSGNASVDVSSLPGATDPSHGMREAAHRHMGQALRMRARKTPRRLQTKISEASPANFPPPPG